MDQKHINVLKSAQKEYALVALKKPPVRDAFGYGYSAGVVAGYELAIQALLNTIEEDEKHGAKL